jgi:YD repeat-containing protein
MKIEFKNGKTYVNLKPNADLMVETSQPLNESTRFDYDSEGVLVRIVYEGRAMVSDEDNRFGIMDL